MPPKPKHTPAQSTTALIDLTKTTRTLLAHFQSSLQPTSITKNVSAEFSSATPIPDPLRVLKSTTTLLRSHTTTLSLLLLTPPFSPTAINKKIGEVSSGVLSSMIAAVVPPSPSQQDSISTLMRVELRAQIRRILSSWDDVLALVLRISEARVGGGKKADKELEEQEKQEVLSATGVVWEGCDRLVKTIDEGVVGLVVKRAEEWRSVLLDAVQELKEWGEDIDEEESDGDEGVGSGDEQDEFADEDDIFGAANKLGKGDKELKEVLDRSVMRLKMVGVLYQALIKRRLKTFPQKDGKSDLMGVLEQLMRVLKAIPESVDELASAFYDLDETEARKVVERCCEEAKEAVGLVRQGWNGSDDEFTAWSGKWIAALDARGV